MAPMGGLNIVRYRLSGLAIRVACAFHGNRRAVTAIEYALIAGIIVVAIVGSLLSTVAPNLNNTFNSVSSKL
jgi:Flp pilus assembly pilin Flp